jgi:amino acid adenylation domain-containing protein
MAGDGTFAVPVSFAQERLWFLDRLEPGRPTYNIPIALHLSGQLPEGAVARALSDLVARHEIVRTTFGLVSNEPVQIVHPVLDLPLAHVDVTEFPEPERYAAAFRVAEEDAVVPFDLERGPLLRATLVRRGPEAHTLLLTVHHIICDLWSTSVLLRDLSSFLEWRIRGAPVQLPKLPVQYADFAEWQRRRISGEYLNALTSYWLEQLADAPPEVTFPLDHPRPSLQSFRGRTVLFSIPRAVRDRLAAVCREEGATPFMGLLACFAILLARYARTTDVVVGTPVASRTRPEVENLIGFFANTLVLRVRLEGEPTFRELLRRVRDATLGAFDHQDLPFEKLVSALGVERRLDMSPLFQVLFGLQTTGQDSAVQAGESENWGEISTQSAKFDTTILIKESGSGFEGGFEYATDLYHPATIRQIIEHFCECVRVASEHPEWRSRAIARSVTSFAPVSAAREPGHEALEEESVGDRGTCLDLFDRIVDESPSAVAIVSVDGRSMAYSELAELAERFAHSLRRDGIGAGSVVGVAVPSSPESVVAVLGILKAGAAYVPLDPALPAERIAYMARDARLDRVVAAPHRVVSSLGDVPRLEVDLQRLRSEPRAHGLPVRPRAADLAYVIYTSGSTGRPKGVAMPHGPLVNLIAWHSRERRKGVRALHLAPLTFDVSFQELFTTWCTGGTVILCEEGIRQDPPALLAWAAAQRAQRIFVPPVLLQILAEAASDIPWPESLDEIIAAGEALRITPALRKLLGSRSSGVLCNQYGPSETHVVTEQRIPFGSTDAAALPELPAIGRPIDNARVYVLDEDGFPVPRGARGELYIGGPVLARNYVGRPGLTAERFLPDPFSARPGARMYKTGDLVRLRMDGAFEFSGRADDQLKILGFRVEPAEIEAALERLPGVRAAAAVGQSRGNDGRMRLVGFVVGDEHAMGQETDQRRALATELPPWMVPERIAVVSDLPLTPSGKLDRRKLARREIPAAESPPSLGSRSELEAVLREFWSEVLPEATIGVRDSFFLLGGNSLAAVQVAARIRARMGVEVPLRTFFEAVTIENQAVAIVALKAEERSEEELGAMLDELGA